MAQTNKKFYTNVRRSELEYKIDGQVYLNIFPMNGVIRFCKKGKLKSNMFDLIIYPKGFGKVVYELEIPKELTMVHLVLHISIWKECMGDPSFIIPTENIEVKDNLLYKEIHVHILDHHVCKLRIKEVISDNVRWRNEFAEDASWKNNGYIDESTNWNH